MLINEMNSRLGAEGQRAWRQEHFNEFQDLLIDRQLSLEGSTDPSRWAVADRGLLDIVGFCRFKGVAPPPRLEELTQTTRYAKAFVLEPLPQFEDRKRTGRLFNRDEAIAIGECLWHAYADAGVPIMAVPFIATI